MLLRFSVENHRSIRDAQELLLTASERIRSEDRRGGIFPVPAIQESALPAVALYGSNASGKSNVLEALRLMRYLVVSSHAEMRPVSSIQQEPFLLDHNSPAKPSQLECTFTLNDAKELSSNGQITEIQSVYTYGFKYTRKEICEEWLYQEATEEEQNKRLLFRRITLNKKVTLKDIDSRLSGENKVIEKLTRPNSLFLSAAAQNNHSQLLEIYNYFDKMMFIERPESVTEYSIADRLSGFKNQQKLIDILKQADIGIADIIVKDLPEDQVKMTREIFDGISKTISKYIPSETKIDSPGSLPDKKLSFIHSTSDGQPRTLGYDLESRGTQVFLTLLLPALEALSEGSLLVIDELDTSLHPDLSRAFLSLFHRRASNPHGAQLLFSTHDVTLLDSNVLEQDEIWLMDKDPDGASRLTPLTDFKLPDQLRHGDIEQAYRLGRFGGVPNSRDFQVELNADQEEEE